MTGTIFNIERFATEDGPGIRTVVFMKGCSLHCKWCANPESQSFKPCVIFNESLCHGCEKCIDVCPNNAIYHDDKYGLISNPNLCDGCGQCVDVCLYNARTLSGKTMTVDELLEELLKDKSYYIMSGGGVTFSGGEPLLQSDFLFKVIEELKKHDIPVLIETCGEVEEESIAKIANIVESIYFDFKHIDPDIHRKYTGDDNLKILKNLDYLNKFFHGDLSVRYPYIPGINNDLDSLDKTVDYINNLDHVKELVFLPYHRLGLPKYNGLGREYGMGSMKSLKRTELNYLIDRYNSIDLNIRIG